MLKIFIADDEYLAIDAVKCMIERHFPEGVVVGTASSGKEAILKVGELKPDIALMDIHMPGIDGIEAIKQIKATHPNIFFAVLTAYDFFDYAKEAIGLGVLDYLLKPIKKDQLIGILNRAKMKIEENRIIKEDEFALKEKFELMLPVLENQFMTQHAYALEAFYPKHVYETLFEQSLDSGYAITISVQREREIGPKASVATYAFFEKARLYFKKDKACIVGQNVAFKLHLWVPVLREAFVREKEERRLQAIEAKLSRQFDVSFAIGVGGLTDYYHIYQSIRESEQIFGNASGVCWYDAESEAVGETGKREKQTLLAIKVFKEAISKLDFVSAREWFRAIHETVANESVHRYRLEITALMIQMEKSVPIELETDYVPHLESIMTAKTHGELYNLFIHQMALLESDVRSYLATLGSGVVADALKYMEAHYNETMSMDDVAKFVNVSYHYFSKLFKQQTGMSFTDYLTDIRIEKSKEMLLKTQRSVKDISLEIGYNDPNYYSKIFKKLTGLTPSEFREMRQLS